jgi:undecaprenyl-diphosphatase
MTLLHAFVLGLIQALTEFFPVSSSAHLKIMKLFLGIEDVQGSVLFDLSCHLGTLIAVLYFLKKEILTILRRDHKKMFLLFIALIPLVPAYFLLKPLREFASKTQDLGYCLLGTAIILFLGHYLRLPRKNQRTSNTALKDALCIGAMQSAALIPGISRSASTIACASVLGWQANEAVRFSFLLSIPTIIGGNMLEIAKMAFCKEGAPIAIPMQGCFIAFITSLIVGLIMVGVAMKILEKGNLRPFAFYCAALGAFALFYFGSV